MILGYSHNIPQKSQDVKCITRVIETSGTIAKEIPNQTKQLHLNASRRTLHNWSRISRQQVFYTARKQLNKNKEGGNSQPSKQQERTTLSFVYFSLFIFKVKPSVG